MKWIFIAYLVCSYHCVLAKPTQSRNQVVIYAQAPVNIGTDSMELIYAATSFTVHYQWETRKQLSKNGYYKWVIPASKPVMIRSNPLFGNNNLYLFEPGDSICITYKNGSAIYTGIGAEKLKLIDQFTTRLKMLRAPSVKYYLVSSLQEFQDWNHYQNERAKIFTTVLLSYKNLLADKTYDYIKATVLQDIEYERIIAFTSLWFVAKKLRLSPGDLCSIYDSTLHAPGAKWLKAYPEDAAQSLFLYASASFEIIRQRRFDPQNYDSLKRNPLLKTMLYKYGEKKYKGNAREGFMALLVTSQGLKDHAGDPVYEKLLSDYYGRSGNAAYTQYVRAYVTNRRGYYLRKGSDAPRFALPGAQGEIISNENFKGKVTVVNFWPAACSGCKEITPGMQKVANAFKGDTNVAFLHIAIGKDNNNDSLLLRAYNVKALPHLYLLDRYGKIIDNNVPDPRKDDGKGLIAVIGRELVLENDGPYLFHNENVSVAYSIHHAVADKKEFNDNKDIMLTAQTDEVNKTFSFSIKRPLPSTVVEPADYPRPEKLFALSDIEGNFDAFRKLLQANKIIDENFNWIFGAGHLVFAGDMFDRGQQVTECLWLIYSLEEKAKAAGGYVHFILGNHEIMNLSGDDRYAHQKYKDNRMLMNSSLKKLYNENSELGRWLRTKNIMEKIGDLLFTHGGVSPQVNLMTLSIEEINKAARRYYAAMDTASRSPDPDICTLYHDYTSPFWYRQYYKKDHFSETNKTLYYHATPGQLDSTFRKFGVEHIVTGHTVVADTISIHFGGKVINTDTRHANGKSEALLIEGNNFYRVNMEGRRVLLFTGERRISSTHPTISGSCSYSCKPFIFSRHAGSYSRDENRSLGYY